MIKDCLMQVMPQNFLLCWITFWKNGQTYTKTVTSFIHGLKMSRVVHLLKALYAQSDKELV